MNGESLIWPLLFLFSQVASSQDRVTPDQFAFPVDSDLVYGTAPNYLGVPVALMLDLYKRDAGAWSSPSGRRCRTGLICTASPPARTRDRCAF